MLCFIGCSLFDLIYRQEKKSKGKSFMLDGFFFSNTNSGYFILFNDFKKNLFYIIIIRIWSIYLIKRRIYLKI